MLGEILFSTVDLSIVIGGIIIVLLVLRSFLYKKFAFKWWHGIWLVLAIRLLIPVNGEVQMNLIHIGEGLFNNQQEEMLTQGINVPQVDASIDLITEGSLTNETSSNSLMSNDLVDKGQFKYEVGDLESMNSVFSNPLKSLIVCIWLIGSVTFIGYQFMAYLTFRRGCKRWSKVSKDEVLNKVFMEVCKELNITRSIGLQVCKKVDSPLLIGYWHPNILIPSRHYEEQELYFILKHELLHYKYGDLWYKLLLIGARGMHWFNPLVHMMAKYAEEDLEVVCDSRVLQGEAPEVKKIYMEAILKVADSAYQKNVSLSTQFKGNKKTLKQRFEAIINGNRKKKGIIAFMMITCIGLVSGCVGITREVAKPIEEIEIEDMVEKDVEVEKQQPNSEEEKTQDTQVLMISGYEIKVPLQWKIQKIEENSIEKDAYSITEGLYKDNQKIGEVRLINNNRSLDNMKNVFDLPVKVAEIEQKGIQSYSVPLIETQYKLNGKTSYIQYVFYDLPNPPPYAYALYFDLNQVSQEEINQILASFQIPDLGIDIAKLPPKNRKPLTLEEAKIKATYKKVNLKNENEIEEAFNLDKLDKFIENQAEGIPDQLDVLSFIETENGLAIKDWYYIIYDGQVARIFGYYELEDGTYTYDNMPVIFGKILRKYYPDQGIISYRLVGEDKDEESTMSFFEVPASNNPQKIDESFNMAYEKLEEHMKKLNALDYCVVGNWVYYAVLGPEEGFHKMLLDGTQDARICDYSNVPNGISGSTSITSEVEEGYILYKFQGLREYDENGQLCEDPHSVDYYRLDLSDNTLNPINK